MVTPVIFPARSDERNTATLAMSALRARKVTGALPVNGELRALRVPKARRAFKVRWGLLALLVHRARRELRDLKGSKVSQVLLVQLVLPDRRGLPG